MHSRTRIGTLHHIPQALFNQFSLHGLPERSREFSATGYDLAVATSRARAQGPNGSPTLVFKDRVCHYGNRHSTGLFVFNRPVELEELAPDYDGFPLYPLLEIEFMVDSSNSDSRWEDGKGFWKEEILIAHYGFQRHASIISEHGDWEFGFLLALQARALELAKAVEIRGHWENEWNPKGDYSLRPKKVY